MRRFFKLCIEIEEMIAGVYRKLAESAHAEEGLKDLWMRMALDEENHARQLRLASRLPADKAIRRSLIEPPKIEQLHGKVLALVRELEGRTPSQKTALRLSIHMEKEFALVHANCAVEFVEESLRALFVTLAADDKRHFDALTAYCRSAGIPLESELEGKK